MIVVQKQFKVALLYPRVLKQDHEQHVI